MLLAQLKHKVPSEFEGMEDVLTASVIGLLKYLANSMACALLAEFAHIPLPEGTLQLELWPRYPTPPGFASPSTMPKLQEEPAIRGDTEPDAVIRSGDWLVLVEAKYRSSFDDAYDQLGREFAVGYLLARKEERQFRLLVVTGHTREPTPAGLDLVTGVQRALARASAGLGGARAQEMNVAVPESLYWTNWQNLYCIFSRACDRQDLAGSTRRLLLDVCQLLKLRGFRPYDVQAMASALRRWQEAGYEDELWSQPTAYHYRTAMSVSSGWKQLLRVDAATLYPIAWNPSLVFSTYNLAARLDRSSLVSLQTLLWHPFDVVWR